MPVLSPGPCIAALLLVFGAALPAQSSPTMLEALPTEQVSFVRMPDFALQAYYADRAEGAVRFWSSRTNGGNWRDPSTAFAAPGVRGVRVLVDRDNGLHAWYVDEKGLRYRGSANRRDWSEPMTIVEGAIGVPRCTLQLESGRLLVPFHIEVRGEDLTYGRCDSTAAFSDDGGATWQVSESRMRAPSPESPHKPGPALSLYGSRWRRLRAVYLTNNPLCVFHLRRGRDVIATVVDHIMPHGGDPVLFWDQDNWQSLCGTCHNAVKQAE